MASHWKQMIGPPNCGRKTQLYLSLASFPMLHQGFRFVQIAFKFKMICFPAGHTVTEPKLRPLLVSPESVLLFHCREWTKEYDWWFLCIFIVVMVSWRAEGFFCYVSLPSEYFIFFLSLRFIYFFSIIFLLCHVGLARKQNFFSVDPNFYFDFEKSLFVPLSLCRNKKTDGWKDIKGEGAKNAD